MSSHTNAYCKDDCKCCPQNFEARTILEIADCSRRIELEFDLGSAESRDNCLHKLDTLVSAIRLFREAIVGEFEQYDVRQRELQALRQE